MRVLFSVIAVASLFYAQTCEAISDEFLGRWSLKIASVYNGNKLQGSGSSTITRLESQGILWQSNVKLKRQAAGYSETRFYDSGVAEAEIWLGGEFAGNGKGTWSTSGNQLYVHIYMSTAYLDYWQHVTYTADGKKIVLYSTTSYGATASSVMSRKGK
jgi:hypothetical protein